MKSRPLQASREIAVDAPQVVVRRFSGKKSQHGTFENLQSSLGLADSIRLDILMNSEDKPLHRLMFVAILKD
jgi:hypothetical protein